MLVVVVNTTCQDVQISAILAFLQLKPHRKEREEESRESYLATKLPQATATSDVEGTTVGIGLNRAKGTPRYPHCSHFLSTRIIIPPGAYQDGAVPPPVQSYAIALLHISTSVMHQSACGRYTGLVDRDDSVPVDQGVWAVGAG
jgi:hypothetical protein